MSLQRFPAIAAAANDLRRELEGQRNVTTQLAMLARLTTDERMNRVWQEFYKKKNLKKPSPESATSATDRRTNNVTRNDAEYLYPARVFGATWSRVRLAEAHALRQAGGEANVLAARVLEADAEDSLKNGIRNHSNWSEQDLGVQLFLSRVVKTAIDIEPVFLAELQARLRALESALTSLVHHAWALKRVKLRYEAHELIDVAHTCRDEILNLQGPEPNAGTADILHDRPWVIQRKRGDGEVRTFIIDVASTMNLIFGRPFYGSVATITNVVFDREVTTKDKVIEILKP